jgi:hypothetical protein
MISRSESRRRAISGESESWEPVHDGSSPRHKSQATSSVNKLTSGRETRPQVFYSIRKCHDPRHKSQAGASKQGGNPPASFLFGWDPPTGFLLRGATLCHIDKIFLDLGPTFSNTGTRLTLM